MLRDPDKKMEKAYARWAPIYDALCGPIFINGRRGRTRSARGRRQDPRNWRWHGSRSTTTTATEITGIDTLEPMPYARARPARPAARYPYVKGLGGDGRARSALSRGAFDCVRSANSSSRWSRIPSACFRNARGVVTARWSDHPRQSSLFGARPCRRSRAAAGAKGPRARPAAGVSDSSGWRPWARAHGGRRLIERRRIKPFGVYTLDPFSSLPGAKLAADLKVYEKVNGRCHKIEKQRLGTCRACWLHRRSP